MAACLLGTAAPSLAAPSLRLTGGIAGLVQDLTGVPQMGAAVTLQNRFNRQVSRVLTDATGKFSFDGLSPDAYSLRIQANSFLPVLRENIRVQAGLQSVLAIHLAGVLSSVELVYRAPQGSVLMSDDWRWVLRGSIATRPVLRALPTLGPPVQRSGATIFSDTKGVVRVSAGDSGPSASLAPQADLGTSFALATSVFGSNHLEVAGNFAYNSQGGLPAASVRTTFSRAGADAHGPEVNVTLRQLMVPGRAGAGLLRGGDSAPPLRTVTIGTLDRLQITDDALLEYGMSLESVTFTERLHYLSPFARLTYTLAPDTTLQFAYNSGTAPSELLSRPQGDMLSAGYELQQDMAALAIFPRVTLRSGRAHVQRNTNLEVGIRRKFGDTTVSVAAHHETVRNAALTMAGATEFAESSDLLPDLSSRSFIFNVGDYQSTGYTASVSQDVTSDLTITLAAGSGGRLRTDSRRLTADDAAQLRASVEAGRQQWAMGKLAGVVPGAGTRFATSYLWTDYRSLTPGHTSLTNRTQPEAGLNLYVRQPLPGWGGFGGRLEAICEMRNLLAQGYLPITTADGRRLLLIHSPRAVRGGLSFIF